MNEELQTPRTVEIVGEEIRALTYQVKSMTVLYGVEIGRRLVEAKSLVKHGGWLEFLKTQTEYSPSTAARLMRIYEEYGSAQLGLFGAEVNSSTLTNLSISNALALLAVPEDERESFAVEVNAENLSVRELEKVIRERDDALKGKTEAEAERSRIEKELADANEKISEAQALSQDAAERAAALSSELEKLKNHPVEVAVQDASEEQLAQARVEAKAEAEEALKKKLDKAKSDLKKAKEAQAQAEEAKAKAEADLKTASDSLAAQKAEREAAVSEAVNQIRAEADERVKALEKQLAAADPDTAAFKVYFDAWQTEYNRMSGCLAKITNQDAEKGAKLKQAVAAALENMRK